MADGSSRRLRRRLTEGTRVVRSIARAVRHAPRATWQRCTMAAVAGDGGGVAVAASDRNEQYTQADLTADQDTFGQLQHSRTQSDGRSELGRGSTQRTVSSGIQVRRISQQRRRSKTVKQRDRRDCRRSPDTRNIRARRRPARLREPNDVVWDLGSVDLVCSGAVAFLCTGPAADRNPDCRRTVRQQW